MAQTIESPFLKFTKIFLAACLLTGCANTITPIPSAENTQPPPPTAAPFAPTPVRVWLTTADQSQLLAEQESITFEEGDPGQGQTIYVNENHLYQQMDGFGASMTDSSAWLIYTQLNETQRTGVMNALFSPEEGIGLSVTRIPIGASDFVHGDAYTYDDMPPGETDPTLEHFSIDHDREYILPALLDAMQINPALKVIASPWSPPAWMKTSDALGEGSLRPEFQPALAQYFVRFIQEYAAAGVPIYAVTLQNEPHHEPGSYPGMRMEPEEAITFVKDHLGPAFEAAGIETRILVWDHNWDEYDYPISALDDPEASKYIDGAAFHCYGGTVMAQGIVRDVHPEKEYYFTECSAGTWMPGFAGSLPQDMSDLVIGSTRYWARTVIKWNLALDESYGPHTGGCNNCAGLVTIVPDSESGFTANYDYYALGHASKFTVPGAQRIASSSFPYAGLESVAFRNPDGTKALVVANTSTGEKKFEVRWGSGSFAYSLPAGSAATFTWDGAQIAAGLPSAPSDLTFRPARELMVVAWEFSPLAETYTVKRSENPGGPYTVIAEGLTLPEYFETQAVAGTTYSYVVSAVNALGESSNSEEIRVKVGE